MRAPKKKLISKNLSYLDVTCSEGLRKRVDEFLTSEYQSWREFKQPRKDNNGFFTCGNQSSNALILDYIRFVYNEYNIQDPLGSTVNTPI